MIHTIKSALNANMRGISVISNNIANSNTTAFKKSNSNLLNTIAIEDSVIGLKAVKAANIKCIVTLSPWLESIPRELSKADLIVNHLGDNYKSLKCLSRNLPDTMITFNLPQKPAVSDIPFKDDR